MVLSPFSSAFKGKEGARLTGTSYVLISSLLTFLIFEKVAVIALIFLAIGDPVAGLVGESLGERRIFGKSLEGSLAGLLSCLIVGLLLANTLLDTSLMVVLVGALCASLVELLPIPINDNLTIPLVSAAAMTLAGLFG